MEDKFSQRFNLLSQTEISAFTPWEMVLIFSAFSLHQAYNSFLPSSVVPSLENKVFFTHLNATYFKLKKQIFSLSSPIKCIFKHDCVSLTEAHLYRVEQKGGGLEFLTFNWLLPIIPTVSSSVKGKRGGGCDYSQKEGEQVVTLR